MISALKHNSAWCFFELMQGSSCIAVCLMFFGSLLGMRISSRPHWCIDHAAAAWLCGDAWKPLVQMNWKKQKDPPLFFLRHTHSETWIILIRSLKLAFCSANKCLLLVFVELQLNTKAACDVLVVSQLQEESTAVRTCFVVVPLFSYLKEKYSFTNKVSAETSLDGGVAHSWKTLEVVILHVVYLYENNKISLN